MARGGCTFKKRDVTAAVQAVVAAGVEVARVEVDKDGKIVLIASKANADNGTAHNEWDEDKTLWPASS